ncbi:hypothetical protein GW17_00032768 [Ensete ventricosum]|nr:hypothetical protein GW17_00032768 [Ensete ventricosum]
MIFFTFSEVERELGLLFSKGGKRGSEVSTKAKQSTGTKFHMLVEDIREGVLVNDSRPVLVSICKSHSRLLQEKNVWSLKMSMKQQNTVTYYREEAKVVKASQSWMHPL